MYKNTLATVKCQIQQEENPTPVMVISTKTACFDNALLLDYVTCKVALVEPEIKSTEPNILIVNKCTKDELDVLLPGGSRDYEVKGNESDEHNAIPTAIRRSQAATDLKGLDLGTSNVHRYTDAFRDNADVDEEKQASQANNESMQNLWD